VSVATTDEKASELRASVDDHIENFFAGNDQQRPGRTKNSKNPLTSTGKLLPNRHMALAVDKALQGADLDLLRFCPEVRCRPLTNSQSRFFSDLPADRQVEGSAKKRSCIYDAESGKTWVEVPRPVVDEHIEWRSLHKVCDEGSVGYAMCHWLDCATGTRGSTHNDLWHRCFNNMKLAIVDCHLWVLIVERSIVFNVLTAPFNSHAFFQKVCGASLDYFYTRDINCQLFLGLYEAACNFHTLRWSRSFKCEHQFQLRKAMP
jgi:hypothetical protein